MQVLKMIPVLTAICLFYTCGNSWAKADTVELYTQAVITADVPELEKILAPNFLYIGSNGHIRDKEHFIDELKTKKLVVDRLSLRNQRESSVGDTRMITANGVFYGKSDLPRPQGLMRFTIVLAKNVGGEQVVLFQATPVISTKECTDGNCRIK